MNTLDITIDLETLSLSPDAAIVQVAAVPWNRHTHTSDAGGPFDYNDPFNAHVSVNSCIRDGFRIDEDTLKWWKEKDKKLASRCSMVNVMNCLMCFCLCATISRTQRNLRTLIRLTSGRKALTSILRCFVLLFISTILISPVPHACFRDARTILNEYAGEVVIPECALQLGCKHDAFTDATLTTWRVWHALSQIQPKQA